MNRQAGRKFLKDLDDTLTKKKESAFQNATCFFQGCSTEPIKSHIISKKLLRRITENNSVLTWPSDDTSLSDMADALDAGKSLEHLNIVPILVDIRDVKLTDPLFCNPHDTRVFAQIDNREIASHAERIPKQVLLLAYRALCSLTFQFANSPIDIILEATRKFGSPHSLIEAERLARLYRDMAKDVMLSVYKRHEQIRKSGDYSQLGYSLYVVNGPPCIAATYSLIPVDEDENTAISNGTLSLNPENAVSFSFLPHEPLTNSICVISWLKDSQRAKRFMTLNMINELSEKEQLDLFFRHAFESPTVYMSPQWWNSLSGEQRMKYTMMHFKIERDHAALI